MALGSTRLVYVYTDDVAKNWTVRLASDDVIANSGLTLYDPAAPPTGGTQGRLSPKKCRRVYAEGTVSTGGSTTRPIRRAFVCNVSGALYATNAPQTVAYTGTVAGLKTTGRRGEKLTF